MYSLIEFANEQKPEVEVVPNIWLKKRRKYGIVFGLKQFPPNKSVRLSKNVTYRTKIG